MDRNRQLVLGGVLAVLLAAAAVVLAAVLRVVVFAITVAYVLYPLRKRLAGRGFPRRLASAIATTVAFLVVVAVASPVAYVVYRRQSELVGVVDSLPDTVTVTVGDDEFAVETADLIDTVAATVKDIAVDAAVAVPRLALELTLFTLLVYGMLLRPSAIRTAIYELVPGRYHDIVSRLHSRTRVTLYSIYVLQALTAAATFLIALLVFVAFGYSAPFTLAVIAGILQFIPIVGPSVVIVLIAGNDVLMGFPVRGAAIVVVGLVLIGFVPDAVIRTQLAGYTGKLAPALYFVGFVGGILTIGAIGLIVGPLVVALLVETVTMLSERDVPEQSTLGPEG